MILLDQDGAVKQGDFGEEQPDPNVYQPDVQRDDDAEFDRRIRRVYERLERLSIVGGPDIDVEGAWDSGYAVKGRFKESGQGQTGPTGPTGPTGACCVGANCSIASPVACDLIGGIYQGDGTVCVPNPCPQPTGACCVGSDCSIQTESDCSGMGGNYQGDGAVCDPNPCPLPSCSCYFGGFESIGRFLTAQTHTEGSYSRASDGQSLDFTADSTTEIDPNTCEVTCLSFSGSGESSQPDPGSCSGSFDVTSCHASVCGLCDGNCSFSGIMVSTRPYGTGGYLDWSYSGDPLCEFLCTNNSAFWNLIAITTTFSDTVQQTVWHFDDGDAVIDITSTITLSDECSA